MDGWTWAAASCCGVSHARGGEKRQDAFACRTITGTNARLIAVLCDGAGSAAMGGEGANLVARTVALRAYASCLQDVGAVSDEAVRAWIDDARDRIARASNKRGMVPRDFASTLICVVSDGTETLVAHIGDGSVVVQGAADRSWRALSWPAHGEYASTTYFVTDEPHPKLVISRHAEPISAVVAFTDGLERLALDFNVEQPHAPFFQGIVAPVAASKVVGRDPALCAALSTYLDSNPVNARTDDDKTLLVAARR